MNLSVLNSTCTLSLGLNETDTLRRLVPRVVSLSVVRRHLQGHTMMSLIACHCLTAKPSLVSCQPTLSRVLLGFRVLPFADSPGA